MQEERRLIMNNNILKIMKFFKYILSISILIMFNNSLLANENVNFKQVKAIGIAVFVLLGKFETNCNTCIPPIEPHNTQYNLSILKNSSNFCCALPISLLVITGKFVPKIIFDSGSIMLGHNETMQPTRTCAKLRKNL